MIKILRENDEYRLPFHQTNLFPGALWIRYATLQTALKMQLPKEVMCACRVDIRGRVVYILGLG